MLISNKKKLFNKPAKTSDFVLHTANPYYRKKILKKGLSPQVGDSYYLHWDGIVDKKDLPKVIFATNNPWNAYDSTYYDDVWRINTKKAGVKWFKIRV